jgi:hypothetical protein
VAVSITPPPGVHALLPGQTPEGKYVLAVLLKRTYRIVPFGLCERAEADRPLLGGDEHYGDPLNTPPRFEADFVPFKLATDIAFDGSAFAPGGKPVRELVATLELGKAKKSVAVVGNRVCRHRPGGPPTFTDPQPFAEMPLRYDRAYGGIDVFTNLQCPFPDPRNPLGRGFVTSDTKAAIDGLTLPNLEDPADKLTPDRLILRKYEDWPKQPQPTSLGWFSKYWQPRAKLAGILPADRPAEQMMRKAYADLLPAGLKEKYLAHPLPTVDFRFFNGASPGLVVPFLKGDEAVRLTNLTPDGVVAFGLPGDRPAVTLDIGDGPKGADTVLHTVQLRGIEMEVDLVWRTAIPYPGPDWLPQMTKSAIAVRG